nr:MAG TPA: hypothetical protein [Herelleviridae sp.]
MGWSPFRWTHPHPDTSRSGKIRGIRKGKEQKLEPPN